MGQSTTTSNASGGGGASRSSLYFFVLVVIILIELIHFVAHDGGLERAMIGNKDGMDYITSLPALGGKTFTATASLSSYSTEVVDELTRLEERISDLEEKLEAATNSVKSFRQNPKSINALAPVGQEEQIASLMNIINSTLSRLDDHDSIIELNKEEMRKIRAFKSKFTPPPGFSPPPGGAVQNNNRAILDQLANDVAQLRHEVFSALSDSPQAETGSSKHVVPKLLTDTDSQHRYVNPLYRFDQPSSETRVCFSWKINSDKWWTHNPEWVISFQNETTYCFRPLQEESEFRKTMLKLYEVQFRGDCDQVLTKHMWSSGWGADWSNVIDGLRMAVRVKQPFQIMDNHWHYAAKKDGSAPVCPLKTKDCYYLPMSRCKPRDERKYKDAFYGPAQPRYIDELNHWYLHFATRPQQWLRKEVHDFVQTIDLPSPCSVVHVRRGDVVLHGQHARRYHAIEEYVTAAGGNLTKTIFLITDDANAISEARAKYPNHDWVIIDRPRYQGKEGGWERHIPSDDPKLETVVLLSIFELVKRCDVLVHSRSNLSDYIAGIMSSARREKFKRIAIDLDQTLYSEKHQESYKISKADWTDWKLT